MLLLKIVMKLQSLVNVSHHLCRKLAQFLDEANFIDGPGTRGTLIKIIKDLGGQTFKFHFHRLKRESNQRGNCMDLQPLNLSEFICFFELRIARDEGGVFP